MLEKITMNNKKRNKSDPNFSEKNLTKKRRNYFAIKNFNEEKFIENTSIVNIKFNEYKLKAISNRNELISIKNREINYNNFKSLGMKNIGNSCYMNSALQILFSTPGFLKNLKLHCISPDYVENPLIKSLIHLSENPKSKEDLMNIKKEMASVDESYGQYVKNDSQMFAIDLIEKIIVSLKGESSVCSEEDEMKQKIEEKYKDFIMNSYLEKNPFEKIFLFHESFFKMNQNEIYNAGFENWLNINLTFPQNNRYYTIEELLESKYVNHEKMNYLLNYSDYQGKESQTLEEVLKEKYLSLHKYSSINMKNNSNKETNQVEDNYEDIYNKLKSFKDFLCFKFFLFIETIKLIWDSWFSNCSTQEIENSSKCEIRQLASLPNILIITINRAILGKKFFRNKLKFSENLNLNNFLDKIIFKDNSEGKYKLYAVNECTSLFINDGHYKSYIKSEDNNWYIFDDETVDLKMPDFSENRYVVGLYYIKI